MKTKSGNTSIMLLPIVIIILLAILLAVIFMYVQIRTQVYDVKSSLFYIVSSSLSLQDLENIAYRHYDIDEEKVKNKVDNILKQNHLKGSNREKGIVDISCLEINIINSQQSVLNHTDNRYSVPVICVKVNIVFNPLVSLVGKEININLHEDIKLSLLEFK